MVSLRLKTLRSISTKQNGASGPKNPNVGWALDGIPEMAVQTRHQVLGRAADEGLVIAGSHLTAPGLGRVNRAGEAYEYQPL